jgi:hypothetical protein
VQLDMVAAAAAVLGFLDLADLRVMVVMEDLVF